MGAMPGSFHHRLSLHRLESGLMFAFKQNTFFDRFKRRKAHSSGELNIYFLILFFM